VSENTLQSEKKEEKKVFNPIGYNPVTRPYGYTEEEMRRATKSDVAASTRRSPVPKSM